MSVPTSQTTHYFFIININRLVLFRKITDIYYESYQKQRRVSKKYGVVT
jgi:hypothetical protein